MRRLRFGAIRTAFDKIRTIAAPQEPSEPSDGKSDVQIGSLPLVREGVLEWPHDPLYRPLVAVLEAGRVIAIVPTRRRQLELGASWACYFDISLAPPRRDLQLVCAETGKDLALNECAGYPALRALPDGFLGFLKLDIESQISMLYWSWLHRAPEAAEIAQAVCGLNSGQVTALDIRDHLAASAVQAFDGDTQCLDRAPWIVWSGLRTMASENNSIGNPRQLARIALGAAASEASISTWRNDHADWLSSVNRDAKSTSATLAVDDTDEMAFRGFFEGLRSRAPMMFTSAAPTIMVSSDHEGYSIFGPYVRLRPGAYRLYIATVASARAHEDGLMVEIAYSEARLYVAYFGVSEGDGVAIVEFVVPQAAARILTLGLFETRIKATCGSVRVSDVRLARIARGATDRALNLLPAISLKSRARRRADMLEISTGAPGCVFFGPYLSVFPGLYVVEFEIEYVGGGTGRWLIEVTRARGQQIAAVEGVGTTTGGARFEFECPRLPNSPFAASDLEIRLHVDEQACTLTRLSLISRDDGNFPANKSEI